MKRTIAFVTVWLAVLTVSAQQPKAAPPAASPATAVPSSGKVTPKAPYESTKTQLFVEKEKNLQLQASQITASYQNQMKDFQSQYSDLEKKVGNWVEEVRKDNGWDQTYTYDRETDSWTHTPKPPAPATEKK